MRPATISSASHKAGSGPNAGCRAVRSGRVITSWQSELELHVRRALCTRRRGEGLHRLRLRVEPRGDPPAGNGADLGVVGLDRLNIVAPRHGNAVLRPLELRLQRQEVLVRFQIRIGLDRGEQASERPESWFCASWNCLNFSGSLTVEASTWMLVALALASVTRVRVSCSCLA